MARNRIEITGLVELSNALRRLPADLLAEAGPIVRAAAEDHARQITAAYSAVRRTGNLVNGVRVEHTGDQVSTTARSLSTAPHGYLYESGTGVRRRMNGQVTGVMPAKDLFIPLAIARRQIMVRALIEVVERAGLEITGSAY